MRAALFLDPATPKQLNSLSRLGPLQAIELAGTSAVNRPHLDRCSTPQAFGWPKALVVGVHHYKVCKTIGGAPAVGSTGRALETNAREFARVSVPGLVGVPQMRRYNVFG